MSEPYNCGGVLPTPEPIRVTLHPDECVVVVREGVGLMCVRVDHSHRDCQRTITLPGITFTN